MSLVGFDPELYSSPEAGTEGQRVHLCTGGCKSELEDKVSGFVQGVFLKTTARNVKGGFSPAARSTGQIIGQITTLRILQACPSTGGDPKPFPLAPC